jgi:hypothetical protein
MKRNFFGSNRSPTTHPPEKKEPPLPGPLLHKFVEERGRERGNLFMGLKRAARFP